MRIPKTPPDRKAIFDRLVKENPFRLSAIFENSSLVDDKGRYLHWDELRFKKNAAGLTAEEWWVGTRLARENAMQRLPLHDNTNAAFRFCEPPLVRSTLRDLDMNAGGSLASDAHNLGPNEAKLHLTRSLAEEPFASSFIEGAATTRQIAKKLIYDNRQPATRDERMVLNNYRAMLFVRDNANRPLDLEMLLELHRVVTAGTMDNPEDAGRIRTSDDVQVVDDTTSEVLHQPPKFTLLEERLQSFFDFANAPAEGNQWIHPLIKAIIIHFMLAYEHPFVDGNGRVARALFYWFACKAGYWLIEYVSISSVIAENKLAYGRAFLFVETDNADLTYFICNQLVTLNTAVKRLHEYAERKRAEVESFTERLFDKSRDDAFNTRQSFLVNEFARQRISRITISEHEKQHNVSYLTARKDLEELVKMGLLRKSKSAQTSIYRAIPNLVETLSADT